jgi:hypothetical protein
MPSPTTLLKRLLLGRPFRSDRSATRCFPKTHSPLPSSPSDPLSSVAYATQEILLVLSLGGLAYLYLAPWVAAGVVLHARGGGHLLPAVVRAYPPAAVRTRFATKKPGRERGPGGGGSVELVDYIMTVAVIGWPRASTTSSPARASAQTPTASTSNVGFVLILMAMNLRGVR